MRKNFERKNENLKAQICELKKAYIENKVPAWKKIAEELSKPSRNMRIVNIYKIEKYAKEGEIVVVPGKVLGDGELTKKVTVAAYKFSDSAREKISKSGKIITIQELLKNNKKASKVRILG